MYMINEESQELDFNSDDFNSFYYTNEKQIKKMDDTFILSKITAKYPDFRTDSNENILK